MLSPKFLVRRCENQNSQREAVDSIVQRYNIGGVCSCLVVRTYVASF